MVLSQLSKTPCQKILKFRQSFTKIKRLPLSPTINVENRVKTAIKSVRQRHSPSQITQHWPRGWEGAERNLIGIFSAVFESLQLFLRQSQHILWRIVWKSRHLVSDAAEVWEEVLYLILVTTPHFEFIRVYRCILCKFGISWVFSGPEIWTEKGILSRRVVNANIGKQRTLFYLRSSLTKLQVCKLTKTKLVIY